MQNSRWPLAAAAVLTVASLAYALPWQSLGVQLPYEDKAYKLGLELHGGVELDYRVDFGAASGAVADEAKVIEGLKGVVERRVNSIGTAEPTIMDSAYGRERHSIVQIPTQTFAAGTSDEARAAGNREFLKKAKDTIGKVVRLEFKEEKASVTDADRAERRAIAEAFRAEAAVSADPFATVAAKFRDQHENVAVLSGTGTAASLPDFARLPASEKPSGPEFLSKAFDGSQEAWDAEGNPVKIAGYSVVRLSAASGSDLSQSGAKLSWQAVFVDARPSQWTAAKSAAGETLDERYLVNASAGLDTQTYRHVVNLRFNADGARIFAEITRRLVGRQLAIFVGGQLLTAPRVNSVIPNGQAVITGDYDQKSAAKLANDINTGIVPAPIYLTSEQAIDPKLGMSAMNTLLFAGCIGVVAIVVFLTAVYGVSGLVSGLSLVAYVALTLACVKALGVVLTLASIAGLILSVGIAIDANILMLERTKDDLREGYPLPKAVRLGLERSWSAIWDSNLTGLITAVILWVFGVSLVKSFGIMLALGIVTSLVAIRWVAYPVTQALSARFEKREKLFVGFRK